MLECLTRVPGVDLRKLTAIDATAEDLDPAHRRADLCLIDAQHTNAAALRDARFCRKVIRDRGLIVFHDRTLVDRGIQRFLREVGRCRAYPLAHDLLVVELNVPSLLLDPRVRAQIPGAVWLTLERFRAVRTVLRLSRVWRSLRRGFARSALIVGAPRRNRRKPPSASVQPDGLFEIHTFADDQGLYQRMRQSFIEAGFRPDAFVPLTDDLDDPYAAITRIGQQTKARYPILCHQDLLADRGAGAKHLLASLRSLDAADPRWVVAGIAGVMRSGRLLQGLVDPDGGPTGEPLPLPVVTLDECFLVFNRCHVARCSDKLSGFHFYGADVCLHALRAGGTAYVIDFPLTHASRGKGSTSSDFRHAYRQGYERARERLIASWNEHCLFCYVMTRTDDLFLSHSKTIRRLFGSPRAIAAVSQRRLQGYGLPLRLVDRLSAPQLLRPRR